MSIHRICLWKIILFMVFLTQACASPSASTETPTPASSPSPTTEPAVGVIGTQDEVPSGTIQIVVEGSFVDIEKITEGQTQFAGTGSGFIIDPTGLAVTNNHVVAGEGRIKVRIGGEGDWKRAKVIGASECSDLAVIQIQGDDEEYPYFKWYDDDIKPSLKVFAAGFPRGDKEFTVRDGIVSKARADGQTEWASVDRVIEHTAIIEPGNSGGPLVTEEGQVVAVNYAESVDRPQYFAIPRDEAIEVIEQLREGQDVNSLGINAQAVSGKISGEPFTGIFVASVKPGSPADKTGLKGGDIITKLQGVDMARNITLTEYCDILRVSDPDTTLSIEVLRTQSDPWSCWAGQVNGRELEPVDCVSGVSWKGDEPSDTPSAPAVISGTVTTDKLNLRSGPGTNYQSVTTLTKGDEVIIFQRTQTADWLAVETKEKKRGWAASEFIEIIEGDLKNVPIADNIPAPTTAGCGGGLGSFKLWGPAASCSLAAGQDKWYYFESGNDTNATVIAFLRNAEQFDLFIYNGNDVPVWPPNPVPNNMGAGTQEGNRDNDDQTKEFVWAGPITPNTRYYVRFVNRGNKAIQYCFVSRPDGASCKA